MIGFGVYSVTGMYGSVPKDSAIRLLREAVGMGVNFFDTADVYGRGYGETLLKEAFRGYVSRDDLVIATKVGYDFYTNPSNPTRRYDPEYIESAVRRSVRRLGTTIDLLQVHNPTLEALKSDGLYRALLRLRREGLVAHVGVALGPEVDVYEEAMEALNHSEVETVQFVYNMLEQEPGATIAGEARGGASE